MAVESGSFEQLATKAVRDFAIGRASAISSYGKLLDGFGRGDLAAEAFARESLKLAFEEGFRYAQDSIMLGSAFLGAMSKVVRVPELRDSPKTSAKKTK